MIKIQRPLLAYTAPVRNIEFENYNTHSSGVDQEHNALGYFYLNENNEKSPCECYQEIFKVWNDACNVIMYIHTDVQIHEQGWFKRVMKEFDDPDVVVVGLGGALGLGTSDIYKKPYRIDQTARQGYRSNQTDWEVHGIRETGSCDVATIDAFFMAVRTSFLTEIGGWPINQLTHHNLDNWICLEAARRRKKVRIVGVACQHFGGGTSVKGTYHSAPWLQGGSMDSDHAIPHRWLYDSYRDVLPVRVNP